MFSLSEIESFSLFRVVCRCFEKETFFQKRWTYINNYPNWRKLKVFKNNFVKPSTIFLWTSHLNLEWSLVQFEIKIILLCKRSHGGRWLPLSTHYSPGYKENKDSSICSISNLIAIEFQSQWEKNKAKCNEI